MVYFITMKNKLILGIFLSTCGVLSAQNSTKISKEIKTFLEKKRDYNRAIGFGYSIQIYNGKEVTAKSRLAKFKVLYPTVKTKLVYNAPEWKVQVGTYKTKLDADRAMLIFKKEYTGLIAVPLGK